MLHGFTGTPREVEPLAEHLAARGFSVECPTLPGHGTRPAELQATAWRDWYAGAEAALDRLVTRADRVAICGLSMGGLLALLLAARRADVRAVCALATPLALPAHVRAGVRMFKRWVPFVPKARADIRDPAERAARIGYKVFPLHATASLIDLQTEVRASLGAVKVPTLIIHSRRDHTAPYASARMLAARVPHARLITLERSFHIITRDVERETVAREVAAFLEEVL